MAGTMSPGLVFPALLLCLLWVSPQNWGFPQFTKQLQEGKGGPQTATISHTYRIPATSRQPSLKGQDLNTSILPLQHFPAHARYQEVGQLCGG